jgi:hypothetical protein
MLTAAAQPGPSVGNNFDQTTVPSAFRESTLSVSIDACPNVKIPPDADSRIVPHGLSISNDPAVVGTGTGSGTTGVTGE